MTTVKTNLRNNALTQFGGYPFTSMCMFDGVPIGAGPRGIFVLNGGLNDVYTETTDEVEVSAWFELPISQLGEAITKQGRRLYIGGEFNGGMTVSVMTTGAAEVTNVYTATPRNNLYLQHVFEIPMSSKQKSEYWQFTVANVACSDFSIDFIDGTFIPVVRRLGL